MYLKRLELQGFKSFADKTVLEFKPGITSVIGPNGSGKSNISDSIRWVLGEQSMKSLRGQSSSDIIFAGTQSRKSLGFAEASIVIDNQDGKLPIEYTEVTVTRKIYRSGETGYFINKVPCRLKDILELFMDTGIGKDGYSIIGQGKIDEILSNKSEDRRRIFEEAAGIVKYRTRKLESEKKLEQTKLNLLRINDILAEIEASIEPLKIQSEKAKQFLDLREELKSIEVGLFLQQIEGYQEKLEQVVKDEDIFQTQYDQEEQKQEQIKQQRERLKIEIDGLTNQIEQIQNARNNSSNQIEKMNAEIQIAKERKENNALNTKRFEEEIKEMVERIQQLEEEKQQKQSKKENLASNREKFEKELAQKEAKLQEITQTLSSKELEVEEKKKKVEESTDEKYEVASHINTQDIHYENLEKRQKAVKEELAGTISELDATRMNKNDKERQFQERETHRNQLLSALEEENKKNALFLQTMKEYDTKLSNLTYESRMKESRYKFLQETEKEKEGYYKSVKNLLLECEKNKELNKGVHGVLANLISVPADYETAIEMCLGASLQNIITETEEDAKKLISYLREHQLGRASFLPISSVKGSKLDSFSQKGIDGVIGIAADLVTYQKKYEQIIWNLLGRTVVVQDMDTAIALAKLNQYRFRIVTIKGDIINPSGAITGGSVQAKTVNILGRGREIESLAKEMKQLQAQIAQCQEEKSKQEASMGERKDKKEELEKSLQEVEIDYATQKQQKLLLEETIGKLEQKREKEKQELEQIETQKVENKQIRKELEEKIQQLTTQIEEWNVEIQEFVAANKENQACVDDLNFAITNLKISVSSFDESKSSIEEMMERIQNDIQNYQSSVQHKKEQITQIIGENEALTERIVGLKQAIEQVKQEVDQSEETVEQFKQERTQKNRVLDKKEEEMTNQFRVIEELKEQLVKLDSKKVKIEQDREQVINELWEEYELTPNNAKEYERPNNVTQASKAVQQIRNQIRDLGSINIDSIDEYKKTKERYDFMCEQRLDLDDTAGKLRNMIHDMTATMKEQFAEKFTVINHNFNEVFRELFGGGKAELILEDEANILECGIDVQAQPPGKKLQNMTLLSGGERALTAIAILFAILKINPAPFCILDEIEAALDDVNVYRYAEYLKKFSKQTQFLVITHRKGTMESADTVYGVTMEENGISKLLSMKLG